LESGSEEGSHHEKMCHFIQPFDSMDFVAVDATLSLLKSAKRKKQQDIILLLLRVDGGNR